MNLVLLVSRFWNRALDIVDYLGLATITLGMASLWFAYFQHSQGLVRLGSQVEEKTLARLTRTAETMCRFGYVMLQTAVLIPVHRH
jgi:hypothetical protein